MRRARSAETSFSAHLRALPREALPLWMPRDRQLRALHTPVAAVAPA